jgi:hypothetical protein
LIPLPWWGPVLAPVLIAFLMICGGTLVALNDQPDRPFWPRPASLLLAALGGILALYVFMADAIAVSGQGGKALRELLPTWFNWPLFLAAVGLMATPVIELIGIQLRRPFAFSVSRTQETSSIAANPETQL